MKRHLLLAMLGAASLSAFADYGINFPDGTNQTATNPPRYLTAVKFSVGQLPVQTLAIDQAPGGALYIDHTTKCVVLVPGMSTKVEFDWAGNWMNSYVYMDLGNDGSFDATVSEEGVPAQGSDILSFSNLNSINSAGGEAVDGRGILGNTMLLPEFTVPADLKPGLYRMRFKVDYNSVDPGGHPGTTAGDGTSCAERGGTIADAMALVVSPFTSPNDLEVLAENGSLSFSAVANGEFTVTATADENYFFNGINVINEFSAPEGYELGSEAMSRSVSVFTSKTNQVNIPTNVLTGSSKIEGLFVDESKMSGIWEYDTEYTAEKGAAEGITSITLNSEAMPIAATKAHYFTNAAFDLAAGSGFTLNYVYNGSANLFKLYVDTDQTGEFTTALKSGNPKRWGTISLPENLKAGVYRARFEAQGHCEVDFLINVYNPEATYRPHALNGIILDGSGAAIATETFPTFQPIQLQVKPTLEGFAVDTVIVRHGQNLNGPEYIKGNPQWTDNTLPIGSDGHVTIPADMVNGDIAVYALFSETEASEWTKVWGDEFSTSEVDNKRWTYNPRYGAAWNRYLAVTPAQRALVNVMDNGYYNSYCLPTPDDIKAAGETVPMISGGLISSGRFEVCYGKIEARAKTNPFAGSFPAFWMMPASSELGEFGLNGWPNDGEIDIWEQINTQDAHHGTVHSGWTGWKSYNHWPEAPKQGSPASSRQTANDSKIWHVYALEWDAEELRWYIDGKQVFSYKNMHYSEPGSKYYFTEKVTWPFDKKFYVIINQSVGNGSWASNPDTNHTYLTQFDYVRVYQKKGEGQKSTMLDGNGDDPNFYIPATRNPFGVQNSIEEINVAEEMDAAPVYYDLSGRRVSAGSMRNGIYIEHRGSKAQKIIVR